MYRLIALATSLLVATSAFAGQPGSDPQPATAAPAAAAAAAAADKVYPPLPTLAMLPPASDDDEDTTPHPATKKKKWHVQEHKSIGPMPRLVVSDASHAYLGDVERKIDLALRK